MDTKGIVSGVEIKSEAERRISCVFSTFNVIDSDSEVVLPSAIPNGKAVAISAYGHQIWQGVPPVGKGVIRTSATEAVFEGAFFDTVGGRDHFETVKSMSELQEWSWGFTTQDAEHGEFHGRTVRFLKALTPFEVSPVLRGANPLTRTLETSAKHSRVAAQIADNEFQQAILLGRIHHAKQELARRELLEWRAYYVQEGLI